MSATPALPKHPTFCCRACGLVLSGEPYCLSSPSQCKRTGARESDRFKVEAVLVATVGHSADRNGRKGGLGGVLGAGTLVYVRPVLGES